MILLKGWYQDWKVPLLSVSKFIPIKLKLFEFSKINVIQYQKRLPTLEFWSAYTFRGRRFWRYIIINIFIHAMCRLLNVASRINFWSTLTSPNKIFKIWNFHIFWDKSLKPTLVLIFLPTLLPSLLSSYLPSLLIWPWEDDLSIILYINHQKIRCISFSVNLNLKSLESILVSSRYPAGSVPKPPSGSQLVWPLVLRGALAQTPVPSNPSPKMMNLNFFKKSVKCSLAS